MTQPQTVTTAQLQQMQASINAGGVDAAEQAYSTLYAQGYDYTGWALEKGGSLVIPGKARKAKLDGKSK